MSVASLAGYLANSGGGGGGSTYYNAYDIDNSTEPVQFGQATVLFENGDITPPVGKYLVNTFITFRSYNSDGDVVGFINNATVIVQYGNQIINNQINYSNAPYENNSIYCIQTSGVFTSIGTDSIIITAIAIDASGAETYNILTGGETISQVQIIGLSGSGGGGGAVNSINAGLGIIIEDEGAGDYTIINDGIVTASAGVGIDLAYNSTTGNLTITNTGAGEAITLVEGAGISIVEDPQLTYTITNTGGGGGGAVNGIVEGTGITVVDDGQGVFTINNSGVLKLTAGDGIGLSAETGEITITNTGAGGDVNTITAGTGIDITDGGNGDFTINNDGILGLTAGNGMQITGTNADKSINFYAFHAPLTTINTITFLSIPLSPAGTAVNWITEILNPVPVPAAGVYLCQWNIFVKGATASGGYGDFVGEGYVSINASYGGNFIQIKKQYFSMTTNPQNFLEVSGSAIFTASAVGFLTADANCLSLSGNGTQFSVEQPYALPNTPAFEIYRLY